MANTILNHGAEYHFHDVNFTQNLATMEQTERDGTKPSKLELLQEDYRSRLLHEREQKANALFEQKFRAELLPKKGSVRDFFFNRRMLAASTSGTSNGVNLPPIKTNKRYKGKQTDKTKLVERQLVDKRKEKVEAVAFLKDMETQDVSELCKLRQKHRNPKTESQQVVSTTNMEDNRFSQSFSSSCDKKGVSKDIKNTSLHKARRVKSREIYKRSGKPSNETNNDGKTNVNSQELELSYTEHKITRARRGVKSREIYKRGRKRPEESSTEKSTNTNTNENTNENNEDRASSFTEQDDVSKSLVKIKQLVHRRKTEEIMLMRSKTAKRTAEMATPSSRRNSQSFDEMCKVEKELRETISREQKKLLALQERRKQKALESGNEMESHEQNGGKETTERKQNTVGQSREKKTAKSMKKYERESRREIDMEQTRSNPKKAKQNNQYETMDTNNTNTNVVSSERNASELRRTNKAQTTRNVQNNSSAVNATVNLVTCSNCGRSFMKERIEKHEKACRKASSRIKKPFDAKRKRAEGTDMEKYIIMGKNTSDGPACKEKKRDWRRTHENFIQLIRSARCQEPQLVTPLNPDYVECCYCQRKFKPTVAETHIPRCKDIKARPRPPQH